MLPMIRSVLAIFFITGGVFFFPVWATFLLFLAGLFLVRPQWLLFLPAILYDVLYSPSAVFTPRQMVMTVLVALFIGIMWYLRTKTRVLQFVYGVEKA